MAFRVVNNSVARYCVVESAPPAPPIKTETNVEDPEEESIRLAIALQLEDLENNYELDMEEDGEAAVFDVYRSYLEESERFLADRRLAEELAVGSGHPELMIYDDVFEEDTKSLKVRIKQQRKIGVTLDDDIDMVEMDMEEQLRLACELSLKMFEEENRQIKKPTASSSAEARTVPVPQTVSTCTGCMEVFEPSSLITPPCTHPYCAVCLKQFFINAVEDQTSFPPRCCKLPIPLYLIYRRLSKQEVKQFREKVAEYTAKDRLYCSNRSCSAFIPFPSTPKGGKSSIQAEVVSCKACKRGTCVRCKAPEHAGDCPEDSDLTATLATAAKEGWQRCRDCLALVEKDYGCQHMSCLCGSEWCYRCAAKWKSCACGDFEIEGEVVPPRTVDDLIVKREDEAVLQRRRAEREVQRREAWAQCDHGGKLSDKLRGRAKAREKGQKGTKKGKERAEEEEADVKNSNSTRDGPLWGEEGLWKYKLGESRCDMCNLVLKDYIWACDGCGLEACMACRENGL